MEEGRASRTALEVAIRRAAHQIEDRASVFEDPLALAILDSDSRQRVETRGGRFATSEASGRAWMAARSRIAEDALATAVASGVDQYVVLGAGLDTFAYRNPFPHLRVFEVDHPATQAWKRTRLAEGGIVAPENVVYASVDFERQSLRDGLAAARFDFERPAFVTWLGVAMYLTPEAFHATASLLGSLPEGSGVTLDYMAARATLGAIGRIAYDALERRVGAVGEPFRLAFVPPEIVEELRACGFAQIEDLSSNAVADRVLKGHPGAFWIRKSGLGRIVTAWR